jgi:MFS family permease
MVKHLKKIVNYYISAYSGLPKPAWMLALVVLINRSGSMVLFFMSLYFIRELQFSVQDSGKLMGFYGLGSLVSSYYGGWLSDKWGTKIVLVLSLLFGGVGFIILVFLRTFESIAIALFLTAVIADTFRPAGLTAFSEICTEENRARGFALNRLAMSVGLAFGPALGGYLAEVNYHYLFWVDGLTCIAASAVFWIFFRKTSKRFQPISDTNTKPSVSPWKDFHYLYLLGLLLLIGIIFFQIFNTWPLYLKEYYNLLESQIGFLLTINCIMIIFLEMPLIHTLEKKNPLKIITRGVLLILLGFFLLPFGSSYIYVLFTLVVWTFGEMLVFPLTATYISNRANVNNRGKYMGLFTFTFSLSFVIGPASGAYVYDRFGPDMLWKGVVSDSGQT